MCILVYNMLTLNLATQFGSQQRDVHVTLCMAKVFNDELIKLCAVEQQHSSL